MNTINPEDRQVLMAKQRKKYTALLSELGKSLHEYEGLERETAELDEERNKLKEQLKNLLAKIGFVVNPEFTKFLDGY